MLYAIIYPAMLVLLFFPKLRTLSYGMVIPLIIVPVASLFFFGSGGAWLALPLAIVVIAFVIRLLLSRHQQRSLRPTG
ncbi:hypothetical protein [Ktedonospora formicarum]|uniref:Uncharacterized protein n=1 Tax=Ktedonospora formicarum TaxID=2778364 RepID=A0A8J3MQU3_9CHLR|nr:hypothetical protein [Ktedonospora formicarum]GHO45252.1 hypothetical protein KSX_34150 [Ktedonospora formicarum]